MNPEEGKFYSPKAMESKKALLKDYLKIGKITNKDFKQEMEKMEGWPTFGLGDKIMVKGHEFKINYINTKRHEIVLISTKLGKKIGT